MREAFEQRINRAIRAEHGQALDGPETGLLVAITREGEQVRQHDFGLHTAIAQRAQPPQREGALGGILAN